MTGRHGRAVCGLCGGLGGQRMRVIVFIRMSLEIKGNYQAVSTDADSTLGGAKCL